MAEKTRNPRVKEQGILGSKSKMHLGTGEKKINPCATNTIHRLVGKTGCKAVKYTDLWHLKREQLLMNVG